MTCDYCGEPIEAGELCGHIQGGHFHHECATRMVMGSAGHLLGMCSCYGGLMEDPPNLSKRDAAALAMRIARMRTRGRMSANHLAAIVILHFPGAMSMEEVMSLEDLEPITFKRGQ